MKPMSGQILRIFAPIGCVYPLELGKNLFFVIPAFFPYPCDLQSVVKPI